MLNVECCNLESCNLESDGGHAYVIDSLLQSNAQVNHTDESGISALLWAAKNGHGEAVEHLLRWKV